MSYRARLAVVALAVLLGASVFPGGRVAGQAPRKEAPANKNVKAATPALFTVLPPGSSVTYRVELRQGRTFVEANGDGLAATTTGNIDAGEPRRVSNTIYEIDFTSNNSGQPGTADIAINFTSKKGKLKVSRGGVSFGGDEVVTLSAQSRAVVQRVAVGAAPLGIDAAASTSNFVGRAFVCDSAENTVSVVDVAANRVEDTVAVGGNPRFATVIGPIGAEFVYVTNFADDTVSVIDAESLQVVDEIEVGDGPVGIDFVGQPASVQAIYVANQLSDDVTVIDPRTNTVVTTVDAGDGATGVAIAGPFGAQTVVITNQLANTVTLLNANNNAVIDTVRVGAQPVFAAVGGPTLDQIWVVNQGSNSVTLVNLNTRLAEATIRVGLAPSGAAVAGPGAAQDVYVANSGDGTVSIIGANQRAVVATVFIGGRPRAAAAIGVPGAQRVLVSN